MKRMVDIILYFALGCLALSLGFFGAMLIAEVYRQSEDLVQQETMIEDLVSVNKEIVKTISESRQAIYTLMGEVTVLKHNRKVKQEKEISNLSSKVKNLSEDLEKSKAPNKPSYETLKANTVYIIQEKRVKNIILGRAVGTGVVVKKEGNTSYILTNKHVCSEENRGSCFVEVLKYGDFIKIPLIFIKQAKNGRDMSLWKTDEKLPNKTPIKGLREAFPQDKVYSVGNYLGYRSIYTEGTFAGYEEDCAVVNMPCVYGCSGSAVFDKDAYLVGLVFATNKISPYQVDTTKTIIVPYEIVMLFLEGLI